MVDWFLGAQFTLWMLKLVVVGGSREQIINSNRKRAYESAWVRLEVSELLLLSLQSWTQPQWIDTENSEAKAADLSCFNWEP